MTTAHQDRVGQVVQTRYRLDALLGAGAFDDRATLAGLVASLDLAAFPIEDAGGLRYAASNAVGDAVLLYALVEGPLWARAWERLRP